MSDYCELGRHLSALATQVDERLRHLARTEAHPVVADILGRMLPNGKHLRPALCLLVCEALEGDFELAMRSALALELIHCGALLHDDVYDRDELRRGAPTLWKELGDRAAMLMGDLMLGLAFQTMPSAGMGLLGHCIGELSRASFQEMFRPTPTSATQSLATMVGKTASLFRTASQLGALAAGTSGAQLEALAEYGEHLGIAFQIADDLADIRHSVTQCCFVGDLRARAASYPLLTTTFPALLWEQYVNRESMDESAFLHQLRTADCDARAWADLERHRLAACHRLEDVPALRARHWLEQFPGYAVKLLLEE